MNCEFPYHHLAYEKYPCPGCGKPETLLAKVRGMFRRLISSIKG